MWFSTGSRVWDAWCFYDWANSAYVLTVITALMPVYFSKVVVPDEGILLPVISHRISGVSLWAYLVSATVFVVVILAPVVGGISDSLGLRKIFFSFFTILGGVTTTGFFLSYSGKVWFTVALVFVSYASFLLAEVFYNSFLPVIAPEDKHDLLSGTGYSWGYLGGALLLSIHLVLFFLFRHQLSSSGYRVFRLCLASAGIWWLLFSMPALLLLPGKTSVTGGTIFSSFFSTWSQFVRSKITVVFLLAFFFYNNGIQTVIAMASIYGSHHLKLSLPKILLALIISQLVGFPGALIFARFSERYGTKRILALSLVIWCAIVGYAYFMRYSYEFFILAVIVGFVIGGSQALSRSFYTKIIPPENSSQYFGFYAIGGKLSSLLGPFFFGLIFDITHSFRSAILSPLAFFVIGLTLLIKIPYNQKG